MRLLLLAATAALFALPAQAQVPVPASYSGNTATNADGTFNRPIGAGCNNLSGLGTNTPYQTQAFSASTSGAYSFDSVQLGFDGYLFLYEGSFNPTDQCAGFLNGNDDTESGGIGTSGFSNALSSGTTYVLVVTGFNNSDSGPYTNTIAGPDGATVTFSEGGGGEPSEVDLAVTPLVTAVPATGGKARFRTTVSNNSDARVEGSVVVSVNGVERRRLSSALTAGGSQSFTVNLSFPARVPEGIYQVSFMAMSDEGEMLDMEGDFDVLVGDGERLAHPSAMVAQFKARVEAGNKAAMGELDAYLAERQAAALLVGADASASRAATVRQMKPALK